MKRRTALPDLLLLSGTLFAAFVLVATIQRITGRLDGVASMVFLLGAFLVSLYTEGYFWGVAASLLGVLAVNFAFRSPYLELNFTVPENLFSGVVMLFVSVMTSTLTTRIKRQEALRAETEKETMRANLLRAVSHDLRTPLTSIYGACSTVMESYDSLDKNQKLKLLGEACADAQWLNQMVENLLSITRIGGEGPAVQKTPTVLEELVDTVVLKFRKHCPGQAVEMQIPEDFIVIPMDSMLMEQVLTNLLENAVYHAKGMTRLILRVTAEGEKAVFAVEDDGCGIPKDKLRNLFTGTAASSSADSSRHGMGIGLSLCAAIVKAHGGEIWAESKPGQGTKICFWLLTDINQTEEVQDEQ